LLWPSTRGSPGVSLQLYCGSQAQQAALDTVPWNDIGVRAVRKLPTFYSETPPTAGGPDYRPQTVEKIDQWDSWVFGGMTRETWQRLGGMRPFVEWGAVIRYCAWNTIEHSSAAQQHGAYRSVAFQSDHL
jgi:hypothetical protein